MFWNNDFLVVNNHFVGEGYIGLEGRLKLEDCEIMVINVYSSCDFVIKKRQWEELKVKKQSSGIDLWCIVVYFNATRYGNGRHGEGCSDGRRGSRMLLINSSWSRNWWRYQDLEAYLVGLGQMVNLKVILISFWCREIGVVDGECSQVTLDRNILDHCVIIIRDSNVDWDPKLFRTLDCWFHDKTFCGVCEKSLEKFGCSRLGSYVFKEKLKALKNGLKVWNKNHFGNVHECHEEISK